MVTPDDSYRRANRESKSDVILSGGEVGVRDLTAAKIIVAVEENATLRAAWKF